MMPKQVLYIFILLSVLGCVGCTKGDEAMRRRGDEAKGNAYATGFELVDTDSGRVAVVYSPWQPNQVQAVYALNHPMTSIAISSCTQAGMIEELGCIHQIVGACNKSLLYSLGQDPKIIDLGDAMTPSIERILQCQPSAMMVCCYAPGDKTWEPIQKLGIPLIYNNEWQETHPLGRAEWIRLVGAILGQEAKADSIFQAVRQRYESLADSMSSNTHPILVLSGQDFRGTWYVPGENSFMGRLIQDAGGRVTVKGERLMVKGERAKSVPMTTEKVLREYSQAQVWIGVQARSREELAQMDHKHTWIAAYQTGQVYHLMKRATREGGNDFWERGVVHPDEILEDMIQIFHPHPNCTRELMYADSLR